MTSGKNIALTRRTFAVKVMSLLNMLSMFVIGFLPRSRHLNFMAAVTIHSDFGAEENKICHCFHFCPIYLQWTDGTACHDFRFPVKIVEWIATSLELPPPPQNQWFLSKSWAVLRWFFCYCLLSCPPNILSVKKWMPSLMLQT